MDAGDLMRTMRAEPEAALAAVGATGSVLCLGVPPGTEVGIDFATYTVGPKFQGIKLVPPGVHFLYASARDTSSGAVAARTGFFFHAAARSVLVLKWDAADEAFRLGSDCADVGEAQAERLAAGVRRLEFDAGLGAYPLQSGAAQSWVRHTRHLSRPGALERVLRSRDPAATSARHGARALTPAGGPSASGAGAAPSPGFGTVWDGSPESVAALRRCGDAGRAAASRVRVSGREAVGVYFAGVGPAPDEVWAAMEGEGGGAAGPSSSSSSSSSSGAGAAAAAAASSDAASGSPTGGAAAPAAAEEGDDDASLEASARERARELGWLDEAGGSAGDVGVELGLGQTIATPGIAGLSSRLGGGAAVTAYALDTSSALAALVEETATEQAGRAAAAGSVPTPSGFVALAEPPLDDESWGRAVLLAELEACFVAMVLGQSGDGLERWKGLFDAVCRAEALLTAGGEAGSSSSAPGTSGAAAAASSAVLGGGGGDGEADDDDDDDGSGSDSEQSSLVWSDFLPQALACLRRQLALAPPEFLDVSAATAGGVPGSGVGHAPSADSTHFVSRALRSLERTVRECGDGMQGSVRRQAERLLGAATSRLGWEPETAAAGAPGPVAGPESDMEAAIRALRESGALGDDDDLPTFV